MVVFNDDDSEADGMIGVGRDPVEVIHQRVAEFLHLGSRCQRSAFSQPRRRRARFTSLVGPEPVELLAQHVRFGQPMIGRRELPQLAPFRPAHRFPPAQ
jgi:hypothetical protein